MRLSSRVLRSPKSVTRNRPLFVELVVHLPPPQDAEARENSAKVGTLESSKSTMDIA